MKKEEIILGHVYHCRGIGLTAPITGEVIKKLENCLIVSVEEYADCDQLELIKLNKRVIVKYNDVIQPLHAPQLVSCVS